MRKLQRMIQKSFLATMIFVQLFFYPAATTLASTEVAKTETETAVNTSEEAKSDASTTVSENLDEAKEETKTTVEKALAPKENKEKEKKSTTSSQGPQGVTGPKEPNGAGSTTYVYNEKTGLWENDYYTWDPVTKQTKPKQAQEYSYNPQTKMWDTKEWAYNPEKNKYEENTYALNYNPNAVKKSGNTGNGTINNTGPNSNNHINFDGTNNGEFDLFYDNRISNIVDSNAMSGDASLQGNTLAGNALSGDAQAIVNILNLLQSSWGQLGSDDISTFIANINGDVTGDLYIDPSQIGSGGNNANVDVNISSNSQINNDVNVNAKSGNATISGNTTGGDATTGNAYAVVNLINMINSAIIANKSFIGLLNINGNLNGDILLPPGMLEAIIAATGPNSNNTINTNQTSNTNINAESNKSINNNLLVDAHSGDATVDNNTSSGSAKSGMADTNIMLLNLTGQTIVAKNAMLVFVNVMGSWVGLIMNAPAGTYAVAATGPNSNNTINANGTRDVNVDITENSEINNNVSVLATSGDAEVSSNTKGGNATSGNASASINSLNMIDSTFNLSDWFGILFINVFGNWVGSFGVNTEAGNAANTSGGMGGGASPAANKQDSGVFDFVPTASSTVKTAVKHGARYTGASTGTSSTQTVASTAGETSPVESPAEQAKVTRNNILLPILGGIAAIIILGGERLLSVLRNRGKSN